MPLKPGQKRHFTPSNTSTESRFDTFLSECSESIAAMKQANRFLYRGIDSGNVPQIFIGKPRDNRKALDTPDSISKKIDEILAATGFNSLRSNSIFCSGDYYQASGYASYSNGSKNVFLIFPKNGFSLTWSPKVRDFTNKMTTMDIYKGDDLIKITNNLKITNNPNGQYQSIKKIAEEIATNAYEFGITNKAYMHSLSVFADNVVNTLFYDDELDIPFLKKLVKLIIVIRKKDKIKVISDKELELLTLAAQNKLIKNIKIDNQNIVNTLGYTNQDLAAALKSEVEICVSGEYYAFRYEEYYESLRKALLK